MLKCVVDAMTLRCTAPEAEKLNEANKLHLLQEKKHLRCIWIDRCSFGEQKPTTGEAEFFRKPCSLKMKNSPRKKKHYN